MIVKMILDLGKRMEAQIKKIQEMLRDRGFKEEKTEMNNIITEMKNTLKGIDNRIVMQKNE